MRSAAAAFVMSAALILGLSVDAQARPCEWGLKLVEAAGAPQLLALKESDRIALSATARIEPTPPAAAHLLAALETEPQRLRILAIGERLSAQALAPQSRLHLIASDAAFEPPTEAEIELAAAQSLADWLSGGARQFGDDVRAPQLGASGMRSCVVELVVEEDHPDK